MRVSEKNFFLTFTNRIVNKYYMLQINIICLVNKKFVRKKLKSKDDQKMCMVIEIIYNNEFSSNAYLNEMHTSSIVLTFNWQQSE